MKENVGGILGGGGGGGGKGGCQGLELKGIVLQVPLNQIKVTLLLFNPSTWYIWDFFLFHIEIEGKCWWNIGGEGCQGLEYWGGQGGPNSQQAHDVVLTSMRRNFDVMCPLDFK